MKPYSGIARFTIPLVLLLFLASFSSDTENRKDQVLMKIILQNLSALHYSPLQVDDSLSVKTFELYIKRLDYNKRFLLQEDYDKLAAYRTRIDDGFRNGDLEFFRLSANLIEERTKEAEQYYKDILAIPADLSVNEYLELDRDKIDFCKDKNALRERWRQSLKYEILTRVAEKVDAQEKAKENNDTTLSIKTMEVLEAESRESVRKRTADWFTRMYQTEENERFSVFVNAFINVFDPHSGYFPPKAKEDFDIRFSGKLEGIGATLQQEDGYIKVVSIVAGSASWRQGQLKEGDRIIKVAQGDLEPVDVIDMRLDDAVRLIRGPKGTEVRLTVRKVDESVVVISIVRDVVMLEETFAKSVILRNEATGYRAGYIKLPSFYTDFNDSKGRNSADDVKKEIEKLTAEGVNGIIFDLRDNGGGSLLDAVKIAGLFIDKGPIVQVRSNTGEPYIFEDKDPSIQYGGPLLILVNSFSASASEILAAALQDYNRSIVMGSTATFGKGTVQRFFELDRMVQQTDQDLLPLGSIKMTTQKFYRINGGATQLKGVIPDIVLPDRYSYIDVGEKEKEYAMSWTTIEPLDYPRWNSTASSFDKVRRTEKTRIPNDSNFRMIDESARLLKDQREVTRYPLMLDEFRNMQKIRRDASAKYEKIGQDTLDVVILPLKDELVIMKEDSIKRASSERWHKSLRTDLYLFEALQVIGNLGVAKND